MGKTLKRQRARAAAEAAGTSLRPPKRAAAAAAAAPATANAAQPSTSQLTELVTSAMLARDWSAALKHMARMRALNKAPKLGSLQRWVSMADAAGGERTAAALICAALKAAGPAAQGAPSGHRAAVAADVLKQQPEEQGQRQGGQAAPPHPPVRRLPAWSPPPPPAADNNEQQQQQPDSNAAQASSPPSPSPSPSPLPPPPPEPYELERAPEGGGDRFAAGEPVKIFAFPAGSAVRYDAAPRAPAVRRVEVPFVPGAFVLVNALSRRECAQLLAAGKRLGFRGGVDYSFGGGGGGGGTGTTTTTTTSGSGAGAGGISAFDAAEASAARAVAAREAGMPPIAGRPAEGCVWMADESVLGPLYARISRLLPQRLGGGALAGVNPRWRLYRYTPGAVYRPHVDGAWPRSGLDPQGRYVFDADAGAVWSRLTFLIYLNDDGSDGDGQHVTHDSDTFTGGETTFFAPSAEADGCLVARGVRPRAGNVLVFPHGDTAGALVHEGSPVTSGAKYVVRSEVLYERRPKGADGRRVTGAR